ncbi:hypothetical protein GFM44_09795 [Rhizobium leguminosarum bv. viciae]|nr:hypothetical protein [Rhizobium leguminosarum bv. viciae]
MRELFNWLARQKGGVGTFEEFRQRCLAIRDKDPENAAMARLLGDLSGRFADAYDDQPLSVATANEALARLQELMKRAVAASAGTAADRLVLLNEISVADLDCTCQAVC